MVQWRTLPIFAQGSPCAFLRTTPPQKKSRNLLEDRFAKGATIVTSQLPVSKWYEYINEPTIADAICDRLTASAHKIELKGESLRKKNNN